MTLYKTGGIADAGIAIIVGLLIGLAAAELVKPTPPAANAQQSAPICQYPDRWSNPPGGCDNSDPAVPECIKDFSTKEGEEACIAAFVAANQPGTAEKQQAIDEHSKPFNTAQPEAVQCGGK